MYIRAYLPICVYVCVNINSYVTVGCVCFVEVFGVLFTGARPYCRVWNAIIIILGQIALRSVGHLLQ